ncbi:PD-(D/E)XK nuclease family protein [Thalassospira alkalitolerans]|uniref:PDDEXK-like family protein n=1 Tax=Thalassospira alkalitolerans TaxID=1293890 RepID=UPI0030EF435B
MRNMLLPKYHKVEASLLAFKEQREKDKSMGINDYSLLNSVLRLNDEVRLHSRFIYSMINPLGDHYQNETFLREFLNLIQHLNIKNNIDISNANVLCEWQNIDLLIHDNSHFLIIENKLRAKDQKNQISRYIEIVMQHFNVKIDEVSDRIAVIYLSKNRYRPYEESKSIIGFNFTENFDYLQGNGSIINDKSIKFPSYVNIPYYHLPYFRREIWKNKKSIFDWVSNCLRNDLPENIANSFQEYHLILKKLIPNHTWRKIKTMSDFAMEQDEEKQKDLYAFMIEARKALPDFICDKIISVFLDLYGTEINKTKLINWLMKKGRKEKWKDYIELVSIENRENLTLHFAVDNIFFGEKKGDRWSESGVVPIGNRDQLLKEIDGLYKFLDNLKHYNCNSATINAPSQEDDQTLSV